MQLKNSAHCQQFPKIKMPKTFKINKKSFSEKYGLRNVHIEMSLNVPLLDF